MVTYSADMLTGELVREVRQRHRLSMQAMYELCGFTGRSTARLMNIERKNSWKPGDRERVAVVLNRLDDGSVTSEVIGARTPDPVVDVTPCVDPDDLVDLTVEVIPPGPVWVSGFDPDDVDTPDCYAITAASPNGGKLLPVITNGQLQTFKRCRRKWWLAWYRKLAMRDESRTDARAIGTRVHRALQAWYAPDGHPRVDPRDALERVIVQDRTALIASARERGHDDFVIANLTDEFSKVSSLERAMIEGYVQWLAETGADAELRVVAPETVVSVNVDVPRRDGHDTEVELKGLLDVRLVRTTDEVRLFMDHKTVADFTNPVRTLHQNEQMLHYHLLEWLALAGTDDRCDGALYNMLRKVKRTARATPPFYQRVEVRHNDFELESYKTHLLATTDQLLEATERLDAGQSPQRIAYPTRTRDCAYDCDFFAVCSMLDDGSRAEDALASLFVVTDPMTRYEPRLVTVTQTESEEEYE
jgi:hypothetical protein